MDIAFAQHLLKSKEAINRRKCLDWIWNQYITKFSHR